MTTPTPPPGLSWKVTSQVPRTKVAGDGTLTEGVQISYQTGMGNVGSIFVADALYPNTDYVRGQLAAAAAQADAIGALASEA